MPISSLIVRVRPGEGARVGAALETHPAVEVSHVTADAVAVVTETPDDGVDRLLWKQLEAMDGVNHVELIYHNFEALEGQHDEA